jgi:pimeloyl-ACP methyl ester carboxylesterase
VNCFQGRPEVEAAYFSSLSGLTFSNKVQRAKTYEAYGAAGAWCSHTVNSTANYVNTPAVARDMLHYSELLAKSQGKPCNESKADYYGASYGTALGTTFAQMFPDRVGHFVLDAVVDMEDYYFGNWSQNLLQADQAVEGFFKDCADAGPACALYRNGSTAGSIKKRFDSLLQRLSNSPMWTADPTLVNFPVVVDDAPIRLALRDALYNPPITFAPLAERLAQLEKGNVTSFASTSQAPPASGADIWGSIFYKCTDNNKRYKGTMKALEDLLVLSKEISSYFGEMWAPSSVLACRTLKFSPPPSQRFDSKLRLPYPSFSSEYKIHANTESFQKT